MLLPNLLITHNLTTYYYEIFGEVGCLTSSSRLDVDADLDHVPDPGIS